MQVSHRRSSQQRRSESLLPFHAPVIIKGVGLSYGDATFLGRWVTEATDETLKEMSSNRSKKKGT